MLSAVLVLVAAMAPVPPQDWYTFAPEGKTFRVELPSKPDSTPVRTPTSPTGPLEITSALLKTSDGEYTFHASENRGKVNPATLEDGIRRFAADKQATLGVIKVIAVGGDAGREFEMTARPPTGLVRSKVRWVASGNYLLMLTAAGKPGGALPAGADRFLGSLKIGGANPAVASVDPPKPAASKPKRAEEADAEKDGDRVEIVGEDEAKPKSSEKKSSGPIRVTIGKVPKSAKAYPPEDLIDLKQSFTERSRDGFRDVGPAGSVLVGVRVTYIEHFGGPKIRSVQPIFRSGKNYYYGKIHGQFVPPYRTFIAKPGYAVGGLVTHTGLTLDGFGMVFMKVDGDGLDPTDSYKSPWIGDKEGGGPAEVFSNGGLVVGLQGKSKEEMNGLGLTTFKER
jgi:hypothetical protein